MLLAFFDCASYHFLFGHLGAVDAAHIVHGSLDRRRHICTRLVAPVFLLRRSRLWHSHVIIVVPLVEALKPLLIGCPHIGHGLLVGLRL